VKGAGGKTEFLLKVEDDNETFIWIFEEVNSTYFFDNAGGLEISLNEESEKGKSN